MKNLSIFWPFAISTVLILSSVIALVANKLIRNIIDLKERGDIEQAEQEYAKVEPLSEMIVGLIEKIRQQVSSEVKNEE